MSDTRPLDDFRRLLSGLPLGNEPAAERTLARLAGEGGAQPLGRIAELAGWLSRWSGKSPPVAGRAQMAIFAGNHGVAVARAIDPRPVEATAHAVEFCAAGGAPVALACQAFGLGLKLFDLALHIPAGDITREAALDERGCAATIAFGMEAVAGGADLLCLSDIGVGNAVSAAALMLLLKGGEPADWLPATGDAALQARRVEAVEAAVALHGGTGDALETLRRAGGREFAALAGAIVAARTERIPVVLDGAVCLAVATALAMAAPGAVDHCLLASTPTGPGFAAVAHDLGLRPLLELEMARSEGTGAALVAGIVRIAATIAAGPQPA